MGPETGQRTTREQPGPASQQILAQLDQILSSPPFRTSKRCSDLLRHVVEAACSGRGEQLKERTLGVAVFDRDPEYDTNQDPVVRTTAGQVRKRLAQYYCEPGREDELRIDLPPGAYVPQIHQPAAREIIHVFEPALNPVLEPPLPPRRTRKFVTVGACVILLLCAAAVVLWSTLHRETDVDRFWAPILKRPGDIVVCVGQGHTYKLKGDFDRFFDPDAEPPDPLPARTIPLSDIVPIFDRAIGINDARALVRFAALFAGFGRTVDFRGGRTTSLEDLRGRSVVLIGAFNNSWTLNLTGELRFYFDDDVAGKSFLIRDRLHPQMRDWGIRSDQEPGQDHQDYAIVSRVYNPTTEQPVIVAAGIKGGGTAAAGEFLTSAAYLIKALEGAPKNWENRNVQFVLKTRLLSGTAGPPQVVAAYYW